MSYLNLQERVRIWSSTLLAQSDHSRVSVPEISLHLLREAVELCLAYGSEPGDVIYLVRSELEKQGKKDPLAKREGPDQEIGDILLLLCRIANEEGWDLDAIGQERLEFNIPQRWNVTCLGDFKRYKGN
jgi:hypothetical protein